MLASVGVFANNDRMTQTLSMASMLGARLWMLRTEAGLNQKQMSEAVGYGESGQGRVSDWERGHHLPTLPILSRYAEAFNMTVAELLHGVL